MTQSLSPGISGKVALRHRIAELFTGNIQSSVRRVSHALAGPGVNSTPILAWVDIQETKRKDQQGSAPSQNKSLITSVASITVDSMSPGGLTPSPKLQRGLNGGHSSGLMTLRRKIMGPAFGIAQILRFNDIFVEKSIEMRETWFTRLAESTRKDGKLEIDAFAWLNKVTLDIIGLADGHNELNEVVRSMFSYEPGTLSNFIQIFFPLTRIFPTERSRRATNVA
ncbi:hypothetical protein EW146_g7297, partial [Bondarzewia mesenterica]